MALCVWDVRCGREGGLGIEIVVGKRWLRVDGSAWHPRRGG